MREPSASPSPSMTLGLPMNSDKAREGYLKLFRSIREHPLWKKRRRFSELEAWLDILFSVRWKDEPEQVIIGRRVLICNRGESLFSLETWTQRWHWLTRKETHRFLKMLESMGQVRLKNETVTTRLFVVNYTEYQDWGNGLWDGVGDGLGDKADTDRTRKRPTKEELKPLNPESFNPQSLPPPPRKREVVWTPPKTEDEIVAFTEEVKAYVKDKGYRFDPVAFVAFYASNGWKVGKNPMKDWKRACVTWETRYDGQPKPRGSDDGWN